MRLQAKITGLAALSLGLAFSTACMQPKNKDPEKGDHVSVSCPSPPADDIRVCKDGSKAVQEKEPSCLWVCPEDKQPEQDPKQDPKQKMACAAIQRICKDGSSAVSDPEWGKSNCKQSCPED